MERETQAPANGATFWQASGAYHGVIAQIEDARLIVSPNGCKYCVQVPEGDGSEWRVVNWRKQLGKLLPDMPPELAALVPAQTPDRAADFERPWAEEVKAYGRRLAAAKWTSSGYAGVIAENGDMRLIWFRSKDRPERYGVQRLSWDRWSLVTASASSAHVSGVLRSDDSKKRNTALAVVCDGLPERAQDYTGPKPVDVADVARRQARRRNSVKGAAKRATGREVRQTGGRGGLRPDRRARGPESPSDAFSFADLFE